VNANCARANTTASQPSNISTHPLPLVRRRFSTLGVTMVSRSHVRGGNTVHVSRDGNLRSLYTSDVREDLTRFPMLLLRPCAGGSRRKGDNSLFFGGAKNAKARRATRKRRTTRRGASRPGRWRILGGLKTGISVSWRCLMIEGVAGKFFRPISSIISFVSLAVLFR
jgi:hypothetical protein